MNCTTVRHACACCGLFTVDTAGGVCEFCRAVVVGEACEARPLDVYCPECRDGRVHRVLRLTGDEGRGETTGWVCALAHRWRCPEPESDSLLLSAGSDSASAG